MSVIASGLLSVRNRIRANCSHRRLAAAVVLLVAGTVSAGPADTVSEVKPVLFGVYGIDTRQRALGTMIEIEFSVAPDSVLFNKLPLMVIEDPEEHTPIVAVMIESEIVDGRRVVNLCVNERLRANTILRFVAQGRNADGSPRPDDLQPQGGRMYHQLRLADMPAPPVDAKTTPTADKGMVPPVQTPATP